MNEKTIKQKIKEQINSQQQLDSKLLDACAIHNIDEINHFILMGANVNFQNHVGMTPLMNSLYPGSYSQNNEIGVMEILLNHGAKIDTENEIGRTVLQLASQKVHSKNSDIVEFLIQHGANVNHQDCDGTTPLMTAISTGNLHIIKTLLQAGANINLADNINQTPLIKAISFNENHPKAEGRKEILNLILDHKPDLEIKTKQGATALMKALTFNIHSFDELIKAGSNPFVTFEDKETLATFAFYTQPKALKILLELGVEVDYKRVTELCIEHPKLLTNKAILDAWLEKQDIQGDLKDKQKPRSVIRKL